jgi:hypothetical protein
LGDAGAATRRIVLRVRTRSVGLVVAVAATLALLPAVVQAAGGIPYGPGPQSHYTVQRQYPAGACTYRYTKSRQPLPDRACTPGALNPKVTPATIASTICRAGYTSSIRPPESITEPEKIANARSYAYSGSLRVAEYDHLVPLELGGDPNDRRNLWVEPPSPGHRASQGVANPKDVVEDQARALVCRHRVRLSVMQTAIVQNWTTAIARVTGTTRHGNAGQLTCAAGVSDAHPAQYSDVDVNVATSAGAHVSATAHYKSTDTTKATTANAAGSAQLTFYISRATIGYTVVITVTATLGSATASCSTAFTPRQDPSRAPVARRYRTWRLRVAASAVFARSSASRVVGVPARSSSLAARTSVTCAWKTGTGTSLTAGNSERCPMTLSELLPSPATPRTEVTDRRRPRNASPSARATSSAASAPSRARCEVPSMRTRYVTTADSTATSSDSRPSSTWRTWSR